MEAAKTNAFNKIDQTAANRGMFFSGFSPSEEAGYTGATYLPALAKIQSTIAGTRAALLGKEADLNTGANNSALAENKTEQSALDSWNSARASDAAAAALETQRQAAATRNAQIAASAKTPKAPTAAELKAQTYSDLNADMGQLFQGFKVRPNYYTENSILPKLTNLYPDLTPAELKAQVYAYRKSNFGS